MRVSAGFFVSGRSGKMLIHTLPPRLMCRLMAIRADSICRLVTYACSSAWMPYSPKLTDVPPLAMPRCLGWCCLRCLTLRGINMTQLSVFSVGASALAPAAASVPVAASATAGASSGGAGASSAPDAARPASVLVAVVPDAPLRRGRVPDGRSRRGRSAPAGTVDVALVDPHLHADTAEGGLGLVQAVVDVGAQRVQRHPTLAVELRAAHLGAAEAARALYPDALHVGLTHRRLDGLAHRAAERHAVRKLLCHTLCHQLGLGLGVLHLENVQLHLLAGQLLQVGTDAVGLGATAADDDARPRGVDVDADPVARPFDLHVGDAGALQTGGQQPTDRHVFLDVILVLLVGVPPGLPVGGDTEPEAVRIDFLAHYSEPSFASDASIVVCSALIASASAVFVSAAFLAGAFFSGASAAALVAGAFLAAAALLACARRARAVPADWPARSSRDGRLSTTTVMWLVRLRIRNARPWARGRIRLAVGPSSA